MIRQALRQITANRPGRWLLIAAGVAGLLYAASVLAALEAKSATLAAELPPQPGTQTASAYKPWEATPASPAEATLLSAGTDVTYDLGRLPGPQPEVGQGRPAATAPHQPVVNAAGPAAPSAEDLAAVDGPSGPAFAEPLVTVPPTTGASSTPIAPPATATPRPPLVSLPTVSPPTRTAQPPAATHTSAPPLIVLPTLPPLPLPLPTNPPPPTNPSPPPPTTPPIIVIPTLAPLPQPTIVSPTLPPLPLPTIVIPTLPPLPLPTLNLPLPSLPLP